MSATPTRGCRPSCTPVRAGATLGSTPRRSRGVASSSSSSSSSASSEVLLSVRLTLAGGRPQIPSLDPVACAERVALAKRGGYCFILVPAFCALLQHLGFECSLHSASCASLPILPEKEGNHVVLLVHLDGRSFVADVGLGEATRLPIPLTAAGPYEWVEAEEKQRGGAAVGFVYRMERVSGGGEGGGEVCCARRTVHCPRGCVAAEQGWDGGKSRGQNARQGRGGQAGQRSRGGGGGGAGR